MMKTCSTCKVSKPLADYQPRSKDSQRLHTACRVCTAKYMAKYRAAHQEKIAAQKKAWAEANKDYKAAQDKAYAQANPEARRIARAKWAAANPKLNRMVKEAWAKSNPAKRQASCIKRRAAKLNRTPNWLTSDDLWMISEAYDIAAVRTQQFGFSWHVDHILPLQGKTVSGLHVPLNLQVIPWVDNVRKGNKVL